MTRRGSHSATAEFEKRTAVGAGPDQCDPLDVVTSTTMVMMDDGIERVAQKQCPSCGQTILALAKECRHCGESFASPDDPAVEPSRWQPPAEYREHQGGAFSRRDSQQGR